MAKEPGQQLSFGEDKFDRETVEKALEVIVNQRDQLDRVNSQFISQFYSKDSKHCAAWRDYGYKNTLSFQDFFEMYRRFGLAKAGIERHVQKTWQTNPVLVESEEAHDQTTWEKQVEEILAGVDFWRRCQGADKRQRVGQYGGLIMIVKDGKTLKEPLEGKFSPESLVRLIPVYQENLQVSQWVTDEQDPNYGMPIIYNFKETLPGENSQTRERSVQLHASRVIIWAEGADDENIFGVPALEGCFNDLITMEKIIGAGGEGFWKSARGSLGINFDKEQNLNSLAAALGTDLAGMSDKLNEVVEDFVKGFDKQLMLQGANMQNLSFSLDDPKNPFEVALWSAAASLTIPSTIWIGQQTGRLASDEDQRDWAETNEFRRTSFAIPAIRDTIDTLIFYGFLPAPPGGTYYVQWESLLSPTPKDKLELGKIMAEVNKAMVGTGQPAPFTSQQIAETSGHVFDEGLGDPEEDEPEGFDGDEDEGLDD